MNATQNKTVCDYNEFRRPRYFHGMLLDDQDFLAEQAYHASKRRLLNRSLHGSGVVCGLDLNAKCGGQAIELTPGLALDCCGNEIWVDHAVALDLGKLLPPKSSPKDKKECQEEDETGTKPKSYYLGIRYQEKGSDPESVYLAGCDCGERTCEYSRYKEGFCVEIVHCCQEKAKPGLLKAFCECEKGCDPKAEKPSDCWDCETLRTEIEDEKKKPEPDQDKLETLQKEYCRCLRLAEFCEQSVPCPECCSCCCHPYHVILGKIEVDDKGCIVKICVNDCREYVVTWPMLKHLLVSIFGGSKGPNMPDVASMAANPIQALCWALRNFLVEDPKSVQWICEAIFQKTTEPAVAVTETADAQPSTAAEKKSQKPPTKK